MPRASVALGYGCIDGVFGYGWGTLCSSVHSLIVNLVVPWILRRWFGIGFHVVGKDYDLPAICMGGDAFAFLEKRICKQIN